MTIVISALAINVNSQEHLKFKGIPIDGNIYAFSKKLASTGFEYVYSDGEMVLLKGEFLNRECYPIVQGRGESNTTWRVRVMFTQKTDWNSLKEEYFYFKEQFQQKYGMGESKEFFEDSYPYKQDDDDEMDAIEKWACTYRTVFETELGVISIKIENSKQVSIYFED